MLVIVREICRFIKWYYFIRDHWTLYNSFITKISRSLASISYGWIHISVLWNAVNRSFHVDHKMPWSYLSLSFILWRCFRLKTFSVSTNSLHKLYYRNDNIRIIRCIEIGSTASIEPPTGSVFMGTVPICVSVIVIIKSWEILSLVSRREYIISRSFSFLNGKYL